MGIIEELKNDTTFQKENNIKDMHVFNISSKLTDDIMYKRSEIVEIAKDILNFTNIGIKKDLIVIGTRGSGKTALISSLLDEVKESYSIPYIYVNCNDFRNSYKIMKYIINEDKKKPYDNIYNRFKNLIGGEKKKIIVFDECDLLEDHNILYSLTRYEQFQNVFLIFLTNKRKFYNNLDDNVKSSINEKFFFFDTYQANEIQQILKLRARKGLYTHNNSTEKINLISGFNVRYFNSDVRIGIKTLLEVFQTKSYQNIEDKEVLEIMREQDSKLKDMILNKLSDNKLYILYLLSKEVNSNKLYDLYCGERGNISRTYFLKYIDDLEKLDLISQEKVRIGKANTIKYNIMLNDENIKTIERNVKERNYF